MLHRTKSYRNAPLFSWQPVPNRRAILPISRRVRSTVVDHTEASFVQLKPVVTKKKLSELPKVRADADGVPFSPLAPWSGGLESLQDAIDIQKVATRT